MTNAAHSPANQESAKAQKPKAQKPKAQMPKAQMPQAQAAQAKQAAPATQTQQAQTPENPRTVDGMLQEAFTSLRALDCDLLPLTQAFHDAGHSLYLVGGSVRDALLGRLSHDLDFTTDARPQTIVDIVTPLAEPVSVSYTHLTLPTKA